MLRLNITEDLNQIHASTTPYNNGATAGVYVDKRAYQNCYELYTTFNPGKSNYKALEMEESHHLWNGLYFTANYTLAEDQADNQGNNQAATPER